VARRENSDDDGESQEMSDTWEERRRVGERSDT
jgi:hypothetical protein